MAEKHELAEALIRLGTLMKSPDTTLDELVAAGLDCGLQLCMRVVPVPALASEPEPHQHVWTYSMGEAHELCPLCGETRPVPECSAGV